MESRNDHTDQYDTAAPDETSDESLAVATAAEAAGNEQREGMPDGAGGDEAYEQVLDVTWTEPLEIPVTGDARVDDALAQLAGADELDLHDRPEVLGAVHDRLRSVLSDSASA